MREKFNHLYFCSFSHHLYLRFLRLYCTEIGVPVKRCVISIYRRYIFLFIEIKIRILKGRCCLNT